MRPQFSVSKGYQRPQQQVQQSVPVEEEITSPDNLKNFSKGELVSHTENLQKYRSKILASNVSNKEEIIAQIDSQLSSLNSLIKQYNTLSSNPEELQQFTEYLSHIDPETGDVQWDEIPSKEWKYYQKASDKFASYKTYDEKIKLMNESYNRPYFQETFDQQLIQTGIFLGAIPIEPEGTENFSKRRLKKQLEYKDKGYSAEESMKRAVADTLWEDFTSTNVSEKYKEDIGVAGRTIMALQQAGKTASDTIFGTFVKVPELVISKGTEYVTGEKKDVPVLTPLSKGYDEWFAQRPGIVGGVSTLMSGGTGLVMGKGTQGFEEGIEERKKYPVEFAIATGAELVGLKYGTKGISKTTSYAKYGATKYVYKPIVTKFPSVEATVSKVRYYSPPQVVKRAYYKRTSTQVQPETWLGDADKAGFVHSTPKKTITSFKEYPGTVEGTYKFGHATGTRWRSGKLISAKTTKGARLGEMEGVSISPKGMIQERFLRLRTVNDIVPQKSSISILPKIKRPTIVSGDIKVSHLPKSIRYDSAKSTAYLKAHPDTAFIATKHYTGGFEPEAKISPGLKYTRTGTPEYFIKHGQVVVIDTIKLGNSTLGKTIKPIITKSLTYSKGARPTSIVSTLPGSMLASYSTKPSTKSYGVSLPQPISSIPSGTSSSSSSLTSSSTRSSSSGSSTISILFMYTTIYGTPTCLASNMCSLVCGIGPSAALAPIQT